MMKKAFAVSLALFSLAVSRAGEPEGVPVSLPEVSSAADVPDSAALGPAVKDSLTLPPDIFSRMPANITVNQPDAVRGALDNLRLSNSTRMVNGFRIRIFSDSGQDARVRSEEVGNRFRELFPEIGVYRTYSDLYYRVTVGDFKDRKEALRVLSSIRQHFPVSYIVSTKVKSYRIQEQ